MEYNHPLNPSTECRTEWFIKRFHAAAAHHVGVRDSRIPDQLKPLAEIVAVLRAAVDEVRLLIGQTSENVASFTDSLRSKQEGLWGEDPEGHLAAYLEKSLCRADWRERDMVGLSIDYLRAVRSQLPDPVDRALEAYERDDGGHSWDREEVMAGLISECRGCLGGLIWARRKLGNTADLREPFDRRRLFELCRIMAWMVGLNPDEVYGPAPDDEPMDVESLWADFQEAVESAWGAKGLDFPLKDLEKASLYLLESLGAVSVNHSHFVRYLLENDGAYRRILKTCYADSQVRRAAFREELARYNSLPENAAHRVDYEGAEEEAVLQAFFFRPDVVTCFVARERVKDLYHVLKGLDSRAYLPRVLHEVQALFGYVTPEACERITRTLQLDVEDVIRAIASYKQYSADPSGEILIYVCKGTACFLRGQPHLSRRLSEEIGAGREEIGLHGIQYIEMDCFGVCHLAPVVRAGDRFYGNQRPEDIPDLIRRLIAGPNYENRRLFVERLLQKLLPCVRSEPVSELVLEKVGIFEVDPQVPVPTLRKWDDSVKGRPLILEGTGEAVVGGLLEAKADLPLGRLVRNAFCFQRSLPDGSLSYGAVIADEHGMVSVPIHIPDFGETVMLGTETVRPSVVEENGEVHLISGAKRVVLGASVDRVLVSAQDNRYVLVILQNGRRAVETEPPVQDDPSSAEARELRAGQDRVVLDFARNVRPQDIDDYLASGGYESVFRVLGLKGEEPWPPERIIEEVSRARLRGRGGAGFPTGRKWEAMRRARYVPKDDDPNKDPIKLIVANGDEGDPGAFMDRTLIEEKPHQLLEGMILAAVAVDARYGVIYVRKEYEDAVKSLENALFQARRRGYLGRDIFGVRGLHFDVEIRLGAGAFVAGEKRAIMRAIEGKPAEPTIKAPSNTVRGLWGKPTLLNNVETFANLPVILSKGSRWFAELGTQRSGGTKIFSVAGIVNRTGLVEVRFGRTLRDIIEICGGIQEGKTLAGVQIGGPSGAILSLTGPRAYLLDTPLDFDTFNDAGAMLGSGGLVFIGEDDDVVRLARHFTDWLAEESCGQCPACFRGTSSLGSVLDKILIGAGTAGDVHQMWALGDVIRAGSQCGLGTTAPNPVTSALRFFPASFLHYLLGNPDMTLQGLYESLEALRLLSRQDVTRVVGRRRQVVGSGFTLRRHMVKFLVEELEKMDRYKPPHERRTDRFLNLLGLSRQEVGERELVYQWAHVA